MMKGKSSAQTSTWMATKVVVVMNAGVGCSSHPSGTISFNDLAELVVFAIPPKVDNSDFYAGMMAWCNLGVEKTGNDGTSCRNHSTRHWPKQPICKF